MKKQLKLLVMACMLFLVVPVLILAGCGGGGNSDPDRKVTFDFGTHAAWVDVKIGSTVVTAGSTHAHGSMLEIRLNIPSTHELDGNFTANGTNLAPNGQGVRTYTLNADVTLRVRFKEKTPEPILIPTGTYTVQSVVLGETTYTRAQIGEAAFRIALAENVGLAMKSMILQELSEELAAGGGITLDEFLELGVLTFYGFVPGDLEFEDHYAIIEDELALVTLGVGLGLIDENLSYFLYFVNFDFDALLAANSMSFGEFWGYIEDEFLALADYEIERLLVREILVEGNQITIAIWDDVENDYVPVTSTYTVDSVSGVIVFANTILTEFFEGYTVFTFEGGKIICTDIELVGMITIFEAA